MAVKTILVIDDSMSSRLVLRNMLQQYAVEISMVSSVDEGVDHLSQHKPDAIFLDRYMPGTNGIQALKKFKLDPVTASIPVVMFTSLAPDDDADTLIDSGAIAVLPKPFTEQALATIMQQLEEAIDGGGVGVAPANGAARGKKNDWKQLQPLVQTLIDDAISKRVEPLLEKRLATVNTGVDQTQAEKAAQTALRAALPQALRQVSEQTAQQLNRVWQDALREQEQQFSAQLVQMQQRVKDQLTTLTQRLDRVEQAGEDMAYSMMDSIVEENLEGEDWADAQPHKELPAPAELQDHDDSRGGELEPAAAAAPRPRRLALLGFSVSALAVLVVVFYLYRSFAE